ncbi:MAG: DUF5597 domain-containing protein [Muribaculum sp.]|nr:DUF5597 domain-containing protein [Muribaculum sp.]
MTLKKILSLLLTLLSLQTSIHAVTAQQSRLVNNNHANQLIVDGKPWLILGGELGNSSATTPEDVAAIFPKLKDMGLNCVLVPAYWELIEPEEGKFDFSTTDAVIDEAIKNDLKVVFLWFGAWKNSMSCYAPSWMKENYKKYPRAKTRAGKPLEIASAFSENVFKADSTAFTQWLRHTTERDSLGTVVMLQIENEIGILEDARDHSPLADKEYAKGVPAELTKHLAKNSKSLHPGVKTAWEKHGSKKSGTWEEVFGPGIYTDEYFMAWNYAKYVERLARAAREITGVPLYVNAAMNSRGRKPGEYPSAGPLIHLKDIWHAAAPTLDFFSPDLYDPGFKTWVESYATPDNVLFIPEIQRSDANAAQAFYVFGEHDAIGLSPFSIENSTDGPESSNAKGYRLLRELIPLITKYQGSKTGSKRNMNGLYFDHDSTTRVLNMGGMKITASHFLTLPWDARAKNPQWPTSGGILIRLAPREFILAGSGLVVKFESEDETSDVRKLGEDGFLESGSANPEKSVTDREMKSTHRIGISHVEEVAVGDDGHLAALRHFNGDETHQGRHVRIPVDDCKILHIRLYDYE